MSCIPQIKKPSKFAADWKWTKFKKKSIWQNRIEAIESPRLFCTKNRISHISRQKMFLVAFCWSFIKEAFREGTTSAKSPPWCFGWKWRKNCCSFSPSSVYFYFFIFAIYNAGRMRKRERESRWESESERERGWESERERERMRVKQPFVPVWTKPNPAVANAESHNSLPLWLSTTQTNYVCVFQPR